MQTGMMEVSPLNLILAQNLKEQMDRRGWTQQTMADKSGIAQTTVGLYLRPERRKEGKDGKPGSAKLTEVEMLAGALAIEPWELLRPIGDLERQIYMKLEEAMRLIKLHETENKNPDPVVLTPAPAPETGKKSARTKKTEGIK